MALPLPVGVTPPETAFLCEMELVTVIPRQRLEGLQLLGGSLPPLIPPQRANIPLWLALLLKRQRRANIVAPPWLNPSSLASILDWEKTSESFSPAPNLPPNAGARVPLSPPFLPSSIVGTNSSRSGAEIGGGVSDRLPYHFLPLSQTLLENASDDIPYAEQVTRLIRDLREVRMAKIRSGITVLEGGRETHLTGISGMELCEARLFVGGVVDGLREVGMSKEVERREREEEEGGEGEGSEGGMSE